MINGCGTALVTPFSAHGAVDIGALARLVEWQIDEGIDFLVPCGSTGEAATMSLEEHVKVVTHTAEAAAGRVPIVAGAGSNDTHKAIHLSHELRSSGATHLLHVTPMYNKPPQRGLVAHFRAIADASPLPVILYNVPGRTAINMLAETTLQLAEHPNIVGVKEASGDLAQITEIIRHRPKDFAVLSGDDAFTLAIVAAGGDGVISVISNATPRLMTELVALAWNEDMSAARAIDDRLRPWMRAAFIESNPIPAKAALGMMGRIVPTLRLPLVPLADAHVAAVRAALVAAGALAS
ncbi:MAG TPA: 4-hydroxy-tetrahydrodipicolinate synthase [Gemmatimonadaceae bacterium]|nr:4-hydroxy-tetrahydrodipicolinate synthase [Gemmatimonadaceae bacterium]